MHPALLLERVRIWPSAGEEPMAGGPSTGVADDASRRAGGVEPGGYYHRRTGLVRCSSSSSSLSLPSSFLASCHAPPSFWIKSNNGRGARTTGEGSTTNGEVPCPGYRGRAVVGYSASRMIRARPRLIGPSRSHTGCLTTTSQLGSTRPVWGPVHMPLASVSLRSVSEFREPPYSAAHRDGCSSLLTFHSSPTRPIVPVSLAFFFPRG
ncbi:hypothetical protein BO71DRAFT_121744 [Aspergillus ellipticus CBS 707.79]|uniref:Uncharacterized protein n=1 Tax=Aspergillus ellipticus CBS 707.79 TaxID=1448320 RepID=A0A319DJ86_9EURO|nr:hypothetical protein BO71DRAFT_121744 [Aspergillus ellipticus CBS 707.79]